MAAKKKFKFTNNVVLFLVLVVIIIAFSCMNSQVFTVRNLFAQIRNCLVTMIFALGMFPVFLVSGFDVSFMANALFCQYLCLNISEIANIPIGIPGYFVVSAIVGGIFGVVNGFIITKYSFPPIVVTIGTQGIIHGAMFEIMDTSFYSVFKSGINKLSKWDMISFTQSVGGADVKVSMNWMTAVILVFGIALWWVLKYTMIGRKVFAVGGDMVAAQRAGISVLGTKMLAYGFFGAVSGMAGIVSMGLSAIAIPQSLYGTEFDVISCIVLGGVSLGGGQGTVLGVALGVIIMTVVKNSLLMIGVPTESQKAVTGAIMLIALAAQAVRARKMDKTLNK